MNDIMADAKARPKKSQGGRFRIGRIRFDATYLLEKSAGVKFNYIVFTGGGEASAALLGGHVDMVVGNPGERWKWSRRANIERGRLCRETPCGLGRPADHEGAGIDAIYVQNPGVVATGDIPADAARSWKTPSKSIRPRTRIRNT